mmetsp:Transcript_62242/g.103427  ORF Transcript_62242/g.103427 Transcript_62242/m.103427 type:complete len:342 (-) Transcript_62242:336-1361(-)|eukprot:CAMPEP_0119312164 /NCGR_PEP_ID=MMETSP1333-20130426/25245_1 /TAXON_ID=418940 /ORGANISM="Scyphosphaera apsteinii, Strain RCC1455" /LENGTH=341 /DNA_ID=CAMNT_0007316739 /DNA_START=126 /DNA_END=1151 /DNA_ORIENTATION=-
MAVRDSLASRDVSPGEPNVLASPTELLGAIVTSLCKAWVLMLFATGALLVLPFKALGWLISPPKVSSFSSILITGASSGIGAELARQYAKPGVRLTLTARREGKLEKVKADCETRGANVEVVSVDVTDANGMESAIARADEARHLDLLIANAGTHESAQQQSIDCVKSTHPAASRDAAGLAGALKPVTDVNVMGTVHTLAPIIPRMQARQRGQIAIVSSIGSYFPLADPEWAAYNASKAWQRSYGMALRGVLESDGIGVTTLAPSFIQSEITDNLCDHVKSTCIPTGIAVAKMIDAIGKNEGVVRFDSRPDVSWLAVPLMSVNVLPPFAWHVLFGKFRVAK